MSQGSVSCRKLFIFYINDMCNMSKVLNFIIFANERNVFCIGNNLQEMCNFVSAKLR